MKNKISIFLALGLLAVLFIFPGMTGAQEQKSQLFAVTETVVKPAMVAKYEAAVKKEIELGYPYPFYVSSTDDFSYYFLVPIENYAGIDALNKGESEWAAKIGQAYQALMKSVEGTFDYYRSEVIRYLPELSYAPKIPRLKPEEGKFVAWYFYYIEFGKEREFADICKQWIEVCTNKDLPNGWSTYVVESGAELPLYVVVEWGKSAADYYAENEKAVTAIGEAKYAELSSKTLAPIRKYEIKTGRPRPDLSSMPKTK